MNSKLGYSIWGEAEPQILQRIRARGTSPRPDPPVMNYEQHAKDAEEEEAQERSDPFFTTPLVLFIIGLVLIRVTWALVMLSRGNEFRDLFSFLF